MLPVAVFSARTQWLNECFLCLLQLFLPLRELKADTGTIHQVALQDCLVWVILRKKEFCTGAQRAGICDFCLKGGDEGETRREIIGLGFLFAYSWATGRAL